MFRKIRLMNFRSFTEATLDLEGRKKSIKPYALIYGENGSGKTNLIESVLFLKQSMRTLTIGDEISKQRALLRNIRGDGDGEQSLITQAMDLTDRALEELEMAASSISICDSVRSVKTIGSDTPMRLEYTFTVDGKDASYIMEFSNDCKVVYERLDYFINSRTGKYFEIDGRDGKVNMDFGRGTFTNTKFKSQMRELAEKFWGNHTFMSLIYAECRRSNPEYIRESMRPGMVSVFSSLDRVVVSSTQNGQDIRIWPLEIVAGTAPADAGHLLDAYAEAIDSFFTRTYTDIGRAYYSKTEKDGMVSYRLMFSKRISSVYREIPVSMESAGTKKLVSMLPALLECARGAVVFIDELDSGIHDKLIHDLMKEALESVTGQMIVTTHNTSLIKDADPSKVYVIDMDAVGNKDVHSIDGVAKTQKNHNNTARYLDGHFGGVPFIGMIDLVDIAESLDEKLRSHP